VVQGHGDTTTTKPYLKPWFSPCPVLGRLMDGWCVCQHGLASRITPPIPPPFFLRSSSSSCHALKPSLTCPAPHPQLHPLNLLFRLMQ
jgi:hypothetical protein